MDHSKLDARLSAALEDAAGSGGTPPAAAGAAVPAPPGDEAALPVFVQLDPDLSPDERARLAELGLRVGSAEGGIATATLSAEQVRRLSEEPSVRRLQLSTPLRLLGSE